MLRNGLASRLLNVVLVVGLIALCAPASPVAAKPVTKLEVEVWMDTGGEGPNASAGEYQLGETPTIYFTATIGCNTRLSLTGPDGTRSFEQPAMYGPVYQLELGVAEESDVGQWYVVLEAATSTGDQYAKDMTSFVVVGPEPELEPSPPPSQTDPSESTEPPDSESGSVPLFGPPTLVPSEESQDSESQAGVSAGESSVIGPKTAQAVYALVARKMASGAMPVDMDLDADGDGQVSSEDARLILEWAVDGQSFFGMTFDPERLQVTGQGQDGQPTWVYNYPRQEVAPGVFLDKSMALTEMPSGNGTEIVLNFVNENDTEVEFWHTEVIPKSVAAHVDDISFSRQPDMIIDADPITAFQVTLVGLGAVSIALAVDPVRTSHAIQDYVVDPYVVPAAGWVGGFVSQTYMTPSRFDALSLEEQCDFIVNALGPHADFLKSTAGKHNIPPSLLAMVILNELIDYGVEDQAQEHIPNLGSSGIAQICVQTAIEHNLVDVSEEEMNECINRLGTVDAAIATDVVLAGLEWVDEGPGPVRMTARQLVVWEKLVQPQYAIEAAAREIDFALNRINSNLDKTWGSHFLEGPIDKNDIYANVKVRQPNETDPVAIRLMQKQAMALMVTGAYNTQTLPLSTLPLTNDPYSGSFDKADNFKNAVRHGSWASTFVETLERCLPLDGEESQQPQGEIPGFDECLLSLRCKVCGTDRDSGDLRCMDESSAFLAQGSLLPYESGYRFVGSHAEQTSGGVIQTSITVTLDSTLSRVTSFEVSTVGMGDDEFVTIDVEGGNLERSTELETQAESDGLSGRVYGAQGFDTCSHISSMKTNQGRMLYECNAESMIAIVLGTGLMDQLYSAAGAGGG